MLTPRELSSKCGLLVQCATHGTTDELVAALDEGAALIRARDREIVEGILSRINDNEPSNGSVMHTQWLMDIEIFESALRDLG